MAGTGDDNSTPRKLPKPKYLVELEKLKSNPGFRKLLEQQHPRELADSPQMRAQREALEAYWNSPEARKLREAVEKLRAAGMLGPVFSEPEAAPEPPASIQSRCRSRRQSRRQ
jgi:hypothetical protein